MDNRKLPIKTKLIQLEGDYAGWEFTARVNPRLNSLGKLQSGRFDGICEGVADTIIGWNFVDEDGEALPSPREAMDKAKDDYRASVKEDRRELDRDLERTLMLAAGGKAVGALPYDMVFQLSEKLINAITVPEKNS